MLTGNVISQLIPFFVAGFLARIYLPHEFGVFINVMAISSMFGIVSSGRLELAIPLPKETKKAQDILFTALFFTFVVTIISFLVYFFSTSVGRFYNDPSLSDFLFYIPICVLSIGLNGVVNNWLLRGKLYKSISFIRIIQSVINNFGTLILGYFGFGINGLVFGWLLSQFFPVIYIFFKEKIIWEKDRFSFSTIKSVVLEYKDFPLINSLHAFVDIFATQVLLYGIISNFFGEDDLGLFAQMNKYIKAPILLITTSISQIFYIEASKAIQEKRFIMPYIKHVFKTNLLFALPFTLVLIIFGPTLFSLYLGTNFVDYRIAGEMARSIFPVLFLMFFVTPISGITILFNSQKKAFIFSFFGYTISCLGLIICAKFELNILISLVFYGVLFSLYYLALLIWYLKMIKNHDSKLLITVENNINE